MSPSILDICNFVRDFMDLTLQLETLFREDEEERTLGMHLDGEEKFY